MHCNTIDFPFKQSGWWSQLLNTEVSRNYYYEVKAIDFPLLGFIRTGVFLYFWVDTSPYIHIVCCTSWGQAKPKAKPVVSMVGWLIASTPTSLPWLVLIGKCIRVEFASIRSGIILQLVKQLASDQCSVHRHCLRCSRGADDTGGLGMINVGSPVDTRLHTVALHQLLAVNSDQPAVPLPP